jgi:hypothetical protein
MRSTTMCGMTRPGYENGRQMAAANGEGFQTN